MIQTHGADISNEELTMFIFWDKLVPLVDWECLRNERIRSEQSIGNHFVSDKCN